MTILVGYIVTGILFSLYHNSKYNIIPNQLFGVLCILFYPADFVLYLLECRRSK